MNLLAAMHAFARVAESGSFSAVARELGATQSQVSKQVATLEAHLGTRLLHRSTRRLSLTDEGALYLAYCRKVLDLVAESEAEIAGQQGVPAGLVRLEAPSAFARLHLTRRLAAMLGHFPALRVHLVANDQLGDLVGPGTDLAIRFGNLDDTALVARRVGATARVAVATPDYLAKAGEPGTPDDLRRHNCLVYTPLSSGSTWHFTGPAGPAAVKVAGNFASNNSEVIRAAALAGLGIAVMPDWLFAAEIADGRLRALLRGFAPETLPIHLVYPSRRFLPAKVRAVMDYLAAELAADPGLSGKG